MYGEQTQALSGSAVLMVTGAALLAGTHYVDLRREVCDEVARRAAGVDAGEGAVD